MYNINATIKKLFHIYSFIDYQLLIFLKIDVRTKIMLNVLDIAFSGLISMEMILNITLSVIVGVFGVCLCFIYFKYKSAAKRSKPTIIQSPLPLSPIETDYRLYDIINEADMLDDHHLHHLQISSDYLDVISASSSTGSFKSTNFVNHDFPCQFAPCAKTKTRESIVDCSSLISGDSTLSSAAANQDATQDYLNPYTAVIKMSPPIKDEYLTLQTLHKTADKSPDNKTESTSKNEGILIYPLQPDVDILRQLYEHVGQTIKFAHYNSRRSFFKMRGHVSKSCQNLNEKNSFNSNQGVINMNSIEDTKLSCYQTFKCKSDSDVYCKHVLI